MSQICDSTIRCRFSPSRPSIDHSEITPSRLQQRQAMPTLLSRTARRRPTAAAATIGAILSLACVAPAFRCGVNAFTVQDLQRHQLQALSLSRGTQSHLSHAPTTQFVPLFATGNEVSLEEEVEEMVQAEIQKTKKMSNLRNEKGVEYAPWMVRTCRSAKFRSKT
jgi:hypothetical protein